MRSRLTGVAAGRIRGQGCFSIRLLVTFNMRLVLLLTLTACLAVGCSLRGPLEIPPDSLAPLRAASSLFVETKPPGLSDILARRIVQQLDRCNLDVRVAGDSATAAVFISYEEEGAPICLDNCVDTPPSNARATLRVGPSKAFQWSATRSPLCTSTDCLMTLFSRRLAQTWCGLRDTP